MSELLTQVEPLVEGMRSSFIEAIQKRTETVIDRPWEEVSADIRNLIGSFEKTHKSGENARSGSWVVLLIHP